MPQIEGVDLHDGVRIYDGSTEFSYTTAQLAAYLGSHSTSQTETNVNNYFDSALSNASINVQVQIHIVSTNPPIVNCIVADPGYVIPANWWGP